MTDQALSSASAHGAWGRRLKLLGKAGLVLLILNEIRGLAVVAGVLLAWKPWERF